MRKLLIQTTTDRGTETRISTRKNDLVLNVFFEGENKEIRKDVLILKRTESGRLRVENEIGLLWHTGGNHAEKLDYKD